MVKQMVTKSSHDLRQHRYILLMLYWFDDLANNLVEHHFIIFCGLQILCLFLFIFFFLFIYLKLNVAFFTFRFRFFFLILFTFITVLQSNLFINPILNQLDEKEDKKNERVYEEGEYDAALYVFQLSHSFDEWQVLDYLNDLNFLNILNIL